jgi:hypothetical protein
MWGMPVGDTGAFSESVIVDDSTPHVSAGLARFAYVSHFTVSVDG